jgi:hypothetical protein
MNTGRAAVFPGGAGKRSDGDANGMAGRRIEGSGRGRIADLATARATLTLPVGPRDSRTRPSGVWLEIDNGR